MGNLISVIATLGTFLGGLIILFYLMGESYFPSDVNASTIGLVLAAALVGIVLTSLFGLYLITAGYIYKHILANVFKEDSIKLLSNRAIFWLLDVPAVAVAATLFCWLIIDTKSTISFFFLLILFSSSFCFIRCIFRKRSMNLRLFSES